MSKTNKFTAMVIIERWFPIIISFIIACIVFILNQYPGWIKNFKDILSGAINVAAILIGFLTTMLSLLIAVTNKRVLRRIKNNNGIGLLGSYFSAPILLGFIMIGVSLLLIPYSEYNTKFSRYMLVAWTFFISYFTFSSIRIIIILEKIFKQMMIEPSESSENKPVSYKPDVTNAFENANRNVEK